MCYKFVMILFSFHHLSKMVGVEKSNLKGTIELFYLNNESKDKKRETYNHFKNYKLNGRPIFSKSGLYKLMKTLDERGSLERQNGSGRPLAMSHGDQLKLKKSVNHKTGCSQRKLAVKFNVTHRTIGNQLKRIGVKYRKRKRVPKQTEAQRERQEERLDRFVENILDDRDLVIDDESWFTTSGAGMPGNSGFYSTDLNETPHEIKFNPVGKFDTDKVMIWVAFSRRGISQVYVAPQRTSMDGELYRKECLKRLFRFIDDHYNSRDDIIFWPDLATCHYAGKTLETLTENGVQYVPKDQNPPSCPQIRPIKNFF